MEAKSKKFFISEIKKHLTDGYTIIPNDNLIMLGYFGDLVPSRIEEVYLDDDGVVCVIVRRMNDGEENCLDYDRLDDFSANEVENIFRILERDGLFENETAMNIYNCNKEYVDEIDINYLVKALYDRGETDLLDVCGFDVEKLKNLYKPTYRWYAYGDYGSYVDDSKSEGFETEKECYDDMRNAVLEKMKWNTEYDEDFEFDDSQLEFDATQIDYNVWFKKNMIVHRSYSGVYVYKIYKNNEKPTVEEMEKIMQEYANLN